MNTKLLPRPWDPYKLNNDTYDLFVATTGFEKRSTYITETMAPDACFKWAPAFKYRQELSFSENQDYFSKQGFETNSIDENMFQLLLSERIDSIAKNKKSDGVIKILIDISSMSRQRMAGVIDALRMNQVQQNIVTNFVYSVAKYNTPPTEFNPITEAGPVSNGFAGWCIDPTISVSAIFGLGYEQDQVLGVVEYLEADDVWVFVPNGPDPNYLKSVDSANDTLWEVVPPKKRLNYTVTDGYGTFLAMESLIYGILANTRPVIIPFGPKILSIVGMIVSAIHFPKVAVWRVSTGQTDVPEYREGTDQLAGISLEISGFSGN